ncbi:MAG: alpha/beta hydrolase [Actinomycetota bacterium]
MAELTILAVHGNGGGAFRFDRLHGHVPADVELLAIDLPGFGGRPLPERPATMETLAGALSDEVAAVDGPVVVLGHGIGGSIALSALQGRDDVAGLILHAPVAARLEQRWFPRLMRPAPVRAAVQWAISSLPARLLGRFVLFRRGDVPRSYVDRFLREYRRTEAFADMFDLLTAEWFESLEPLATPTVILWGEHDRVLGADQADELLRLVPGADVEHVAGWGHFPMVEQPEDYLDRVVELARGLLPTGTGG